MGFITAINQKKMIKYQIVVDIGTLSSVAEFPKIKKIRNIVLENVVTQLEITNSKRVLTSDQ